MINIFVKVLLLIIILHGFLAPVEDEIKTQEPDEASFLINLDLEIEILLSWTELSSNTGILFFW